MKTDAQLKLDIIAELNWENSINASHIGVEVDNWSERKLAEHSAWCSPSVRSANNNITLVF